MSEGWITKYRPEDFKDVIGQDAVVKSLQRAIKKDRSHAFLLHGPSGTGKTTLARISAAALGAGNNILDFDAATHNSVDDIRPIVESMGFHPLNGGSRAIIVDECHVLSGSAWKPLLKATEEPPRWLYWFFCTTEVGKVPETIKTRCLSYKLKEVEEKELEALLTNIAKAEDVDVDEEIIELCANRAKGSPRLAISNLASVAGAKNNSEAKALLEEAEGKEQVIQLARVLLNRSAWPRVQDVLRGLKGENGESVRHVIRAYMTNVILSSDKEPVVGRCLEILDAFSEPFPSGDGFSPVVLAAGKLCV